MSTIRIFSKKAFAFGPGAVQGSDVIENFVTVPGTFQDMPEPETPAGEDDGPISGTGSPSTKLTKPLA